MEQSLELDDQSICDFLTFFAQHTYSADGKSSEPRDYLADVIKLMEKDYKIVKLSNEGGNLCFQYPAIIPILESRNCLPIIEDDVEDKFAYQKVDPKVINDILSDARYARCRQRFPVPVIRFEGKYICRSATVAGIPEMCYRNGFENVSSLQALYSLKDFLWPNEDPPIETPIPKNLSDEAFPDSGAKEFCDKVRKADVELLKMFNVNNIIDIMVEKRKVKSGIYVSSSEKVVPETYANFKLISLPYPGCEFFTKYEDSMFNPTGLRYNWENPYNDAVIAVPNDNASRVLNIDWSQYKTWDIVQMTQNYIKYIIKRLQDDSSGILLHCISGWDRTPLYMSLIRITLWADCLVHESLNEYEILYLTLVYDWYLFGHHLYNRLYKNEEIMAFCFDFLKYITKDDFSAKAGKKRLSEEKVSEEPRTASAALNGAKAKPFSEEIDPNENSHDSIMDTGFEELGGNKSESSNIHESMEVPVSPEGFIDGADMDDAMLPYSEDITDNHSPESSSSSSGLSTPSRHHQLKNSPILIPGKRQRSESTGSSASTLSWQVVTECGSIEKESVMKSMRQQRLDRVRTLFNACYQRTVKKDSFGPPPKLTIERTLRNLASYLDSKSASDVVNANSIKTNGVKDVNGENANN